MNRIQHLLERIRDLEFISKMDQRYIAKLESENAALRKENSGLREHTRNLGALYHRELEKIA